MAARAYRGQGDKGANPGLFFGPARRLAKHLDSDCPITPGPPALTHIVVADGEERELLLSKHVSEHRALWQQLLTFSEVKLLAFGKDCDDHLEKRGEFSTRMNDMRGTEKGVDWREPYEPALDYFNTGSPECERFDAMVRVHSLSVAKTAAEAPKFKFRRSNDTSDLDLLMQVGLGAFLATEDKRMLREVRACGTYQVPWVRTIDEYLAVDVNDLPQCLPWGDEARREAAKFAAHEVGGKHR